MVCFVSLQGARDKILQRHVVRPLGLEQSVGLQVYLRVFLSRFTLSFCIATKRKSEQRFLNNIFYVKNLSDIEFFIIIKLMTEIDISRLEEIKTKVHQSLRKPNFSATKAPYQSFWG